jgi:hypothetical protein
MFGWLLGDGGSDEPGEIRISTDVDILVKFNGRKKGQLEDAHRASWEVPPGTHTIEVYLPMTLTSWGASASASVKVKGGQQRQFHVSKGWLGGLSLTEIEWQL